jgi:hypothetical protein
VNIFLRYLKYLFKNKCFAILSFIKLSNLDHLKNQFDALFEENYFLKLGKKKNQKGDPYKKRKYFFFTLKIIKNC